MKTKRRESEKLSVTTTPSKEQGGSGPGNAASTSSPSQMSPASSEIHKAMVNLSKQLHVVKEKGDGMVHTLENIERAKHRLNSNIDKQGRSGSPSVSYSRSRLRSLLSNAINEAKSEAQAIQSAIKFCKTVSKDSSASVLSVNSPSSAPIRRGVLMALLMRQAENLPVWMPSLTDVDEEPPPLVGAEPVEMYYTAKPGDMVAAKVRSEDADEVDENWILAEVSCFNQASSKYEVVDIDAEEGKQMHVLSRRRVIPLPIWRANPKTHSDCLFQHGTVVLALYPQTTCFYKGIVDRPPRRVREPYQILFEDDCYPDHLSPPFPVAQRYVICFRDDGKSKSSKT